MISRLISGFALSVCVALVPSHAFAKPAKKSKNAKVKTEEKAAAKEVLAPASAEQPEEALVETSEPKKGKPKMPIAAETDSSSAGVRESKNGSIGLRAGMLFGGISGGGLDGFMHKSPSLLLGGAFYSGGTDFKDSLNEDKSSVRLNKAEVSDYMFLLQARWFVGNSFNLTGGLGQRKISASFEAESVSSGDKVGIDVDVTSLVAQFALGNTWSFKSGFVLGADWIGYSYPLTSSRKVSSSATGSVSSALQDFQDIGEDLGDSLGKAGAAMLLVLNVGWAF